LPLRPGHQAARTLLAATTGAFAAPRLEAVSLDTAHP
jgi:hypothetical protein